MDNDERKGRPSASSAEQMRDCPASWLRQQDVAETRSGTDWSELGNDGHAWLAGDKSVKLDAEEMECAAECDRLVAELLESLGLKGRHETERRFWAHADLFSAKLDLIVVSLGEAVLLVDYKFGFNEVAPAADNLQMRWQFLAAVNEGTDFFVAVVSPRNYKSKVTVARYGIEHYEPAMREAQRIIAAAESPDAPAIPGENQCRYCKAKGTCAEYQSYARQVLPAEIRELPVGQWTPDQRVRFVVAAKAAENLLDEKLTEIMAEVERDPAGNPGLRLRSTGSVRKVTDNAAASAALSGHLSPSGIASCMTISVPKIEAAVAVQNEITKKAAADRVQRVLGPLIETTAKQPSLEVV